MRIRERRLRFEKLEQRKQFAGDGLSESLPVSAADDVLRSDSVPMDGVRAAEVRIQFDPLSVQPDLDTIKAGDAWKGTASVVANVDTEAGLLVAFLFTTQPIVGQGNLLELGFKSIDSMPVDGSSPAIGLETVRLNEGTIELTSDLTVLTAPPQPNVDGSADSVSVSDSDSEAVVEEARLDRDVIAEETPLPVDQASHDELAHFGFDAWKTITGRYETRDEWMQREAIQASKRPEQRHRLHDMSVTGVFIGPIRPDNLGG